MQSPELPGTSDSLFEKTRTSAPCPWVVSFLSQGLLKGINLLFVINKQKNRTITVISPLQPKITLCFQFFQLLQDDFATLYPTTFRMKSTKFLNEEVGAEWTAKVHVTSHDAIGTRSYGKGQTVEVRIKHCLQSDQLMYGIHMCSMLFKCVEPSWQT